MKASSKDASDQAGIPTVASLGVRVRLTPIDADRECKLARLIASGETLRLEWESLFQQVVDLLSEDLRSVQDTDSSSSPSDL
jgi:hypothetical protein